MQFEQLHILAFIFLKTFLAYFPKIGLCDLHPVCVSVYPPINV
jgi:hypothetical protein